MTKNKGFTLVELLIVIGILAVLSTATVLILNPAQILAESRDTQRMNDLNAISAAISLVMATVSTPSLAPADWACATEFGSTFATAAKLFSTVALVEATLPAHSGSSSAMRAIDGTGWVGANIGALSGGAPLAVLPIDPSNGATYNYQYACSATAFELDANLESTRYAVTAATEKESTDGGTTATAYETGSTLSL